MEKLTLDQQLDRKQAARYRREDKAEEKLIKREMYAERMIGELKRDGKTVYYISPIPGHYQEGERGDLMAFLLRHKYA